VSPLPDVCMPSRFAGRHDELRLLQSLVEELDGHRGGVAILAGCAGSGRRTLLCKTMTQARARGYNVAMGGSKENGRPYGAIAEALLACIRSLPEGTAAAGIGALGGDLIKVLPEIRPLLNPAQCEAPAADPEQERQRLWESIADFLTTAGKGTPLVLGLTNFERSSLSEAGLAGYLAHRLLESRVLILITVDESWQSSFDTGRILAMLRLDGFSPAEVDEFVAAAGYSVLRGLREVRPQPMFAENVLLALAEGDAAESISGSSLHEVMSQRFQRLPFATQSVLGAASVFGQQFETGLLGSVTGLARGMIEKALGPALEAGILVAQPEGTATLLFRHDLWRRLAYASCPRKNLPALHAAALGSLEAEVASSDLARAAELAGHADRAGTEIPAAKAIDLLQRAGDLAWGSCALEETSRWWRAVLTRLSPDDDRRVPLLTQLGEISILTGIDAQEGLAMLEEALRLCTNRGQSLRAARIHTRIGRNLSLRSGETQDLRQALSHYQSAQKIIDTIGDRRAAAFLASARAALCMYLLRIDEGLDCSRRALDLAQELVDPAITAAATVLHGLHQCTAGYPDKGIAEVEGAWAALTAKGNHVVYAIWRGEVGLDLLDLPSVEQWYAGVLEQPGLALARRRLARSLIRVYLRAGRLNEARRLYLDAGPGTERFSWRAPAGDVLPLEWSFWSGDLRRAESLLRDALSVAVRSGDRSAELYCCMNLGRISQAENQLAKAAEMYRRAVELALEGGQRVLELQVRVDLALLMCRLHRQPDVEAEMRRCREIVSNGENWAGLKGRFILAEAVAAGMRGDCAEADTAFREAARVFRRHGLAWDEAESICFKIRFQAGYVPSDTVNELRRQIDELCRGTGLCVRLAELMAG
jgi:tetratricopeptide (TPR) repeat protein